MPYYIDVLWAWLERHDKLAAWVQAASSVGAIVFTIVLWQVDKCRQRKLHEASQRAHAERIALGLKQEIKEAIEACDFHEVGCASVLDAFIKATREGGTPSMGTPFPAGSLAVTDATIYQGVAAELSTLPEGVATRIVSFYSFASNMARLATTGPSAVETCRALLPQFSRLRMTGVLATIAIDKFAATGYSDEAVIAIRPEEVVAAAEKARYPLAEIAATYGVDVGRAGERSSTT